MKGNGEWCIQANPQNNWTGEESLRCEKWDWWEGREIFSPFRDNRKQSLLFIWNKLTSFGSGALWSCLLGSSNLPLLLIVLVHPRPLCLCLLLSLSVLFLHLSLSSVTTSAFVSSVSKSLKAPPLLLERGSDALLAGFLPCLISDPSDGAAWDQEESVDGGGSLDTRLEHMTSHQPLPKRESRNLAGSAKASLHLSVTAQEAYVSEGAQKGKSRSGGGKNKTTLMD